MMKTMTHIVRKIKAKGRMGANNSRWSVNCCLLTAKKRGFTQNGRTQCSDGTIWLHEMKKKKKDEMKRKEEEH